jgi:hypothetical protein
VWIGDMGGRKGVPGPNGTNNGLVAPSSSRARDNSLGDVRWCGDCDREDRLNRGEMGLLWCGLDWPRTSRSTNSV